jgi:hypothetical protein
MLDLELRYDGGRIMIPVRDHDQHLIALLRYLPWSDPRQPNMLTARRSQPMLLPHPAAETSRRVQLVDGEPDMIAAWSCDVPAIAVSGVDCWRAEWAPLVTDRHVAIVIDAAAQGQAHDARIAFDLEGQAEAGTVDVAPDRDQGYDVTDLLREVGRASVGKLLSPASGAISRPPQPDKVP